jgi:hypothetical protein
LDLQSYRALQPSGLRIAPAVNILINLLVILQPGNSGRETAIQINGLCKERTQPCKADAKNIGELLLVIHVIYRAVNTNESTVFA